MSYFSLYLKSWSQRKTAVQNPKLWSDRFFPKQWWKSDRSRNLNKKMARAIPNVHDQPESFRYRWPTVMNLIRPVKFKTVSQPRILDAWHKWRDTGRIFVTQNFRPFSAVCLTVFVFEFWPSPLNSTKKKAYKIREYDFGVQFDLTVIVWSENFAA